MISLNVLNGLVNLSNEIRHTTSFALVFLHHFLVLLLFTAPSFRENAFRLAAMASLTLNIAITLALRRAITFFAKESIPWILTTAMFGCIIYHVWWLIRDVLWILVGSIEDPPVWLLRGLDHFDSLVDPGQQHPRETRTPLSRSWSWFLVIFLFRPLLDRVLIHGHLHIRQCYWMTLLVVLLCDLVTIIRTTVLVQ